jgi:hypothetical protein
VLPSGDAIVTRWRRFSLQNHKHGILVTMETRESRQAGHDSIIQITSIASYICWLMLNKMWRCRPGLTDSRQNAARKLKVPLKVVYRPLDLTQFGFTLNWAVQVAKQYKSGLFCCTYFSETQRPTNTLSLVAETSICQVLLVPTERHNAAICEASRSASSGAHPASYSMGQRELGRGQERMELYLQPAHAFMACTGTTLTAAETRSKGRL